jgi:S-methylmethionine-dependent homocysteine/selenocysteine methylase
MKQSGPLGERIGAGELIIIDGGMGSEIEAQGVPMDDTAWCALANLRHVDVVQDIHEQYIRAGADVIIANTFPAGRVVLESAGHGDEFEEINRRAVAAAFRAREAVGSSTIVAGAIGGLPTAANADFTFRGLSEDELFDGFREQAVLLADSGVDLLALEMLGPGGYALPALRAAVSVGLPVWAGISVLRVIDGIETDYGTLADPTDRQEFVQLVDELSGPNTSALTVMHSHVDEVIPALELIAQRWSGVVGAYPHVGKFERPHWKFEDVSPDAFLAHAREWVASGAQLIGGCCGIRPAHIAALKAGLVTGTSVTSDA